MRKYVISVLVAVLCLSVTVRAGNMQEMDKAWQDRNTLTAASSTSLYSGYEGLLKVDPQNYQLLWMYSRALNFAGMYLVDAADQKKKIFQMAKDAALKATKISPDRVEGHIWLAVALGNWGEVNGVLKSLSLVPEIERNFNEVLTKDPNADEAVAYRALGRVYMKAPGAPLSVGDLAKSEQYLRKACELGPFNKKNYYYLAETLVKRKQNDKALEVIEKALAMPIRPGDALEEKSDIRQMKELQEKIKSRTDK